MRRTGRPGFSRDDRAVPAWTMRRQHHSETSGRAVLLAALLIPVIAVAIALHGLTRATDDGSALQLLRAVLPALTDVDQALAAHEADIKAAAGIDAATVAAPGLPITVSVRRQDALAGGDQLRRATIDALAAAVRRDGPDAFRAADARAAPEDPSLFTKQWAVRRSLDTLTAERHSSIARAGLVALGIAVALTALLALQVDGSSRAASVGSVVLAGAIGGCLIALAGRVGVWVFASDSGVTARVVARVVYDLSMSIIAVAIVCGVAGLLVVVIGLVTGRLVTEPASVQPPRAASDRTAAPIRDPWKE